MHVLVSSSVLARAHELVVDPSCRSAALADGVVDFLLVYNCHSVEVVVSEVQVLSRLVFHVFALVVIEGQLLYFETVLVVYFVSHAAWRAVGALSLPARLTVVVVGEGNLGVALIRRHLRTVHTECVHVLRVIIYELLLPLA